MGTLIRDGVKIGGTTVYVDSNLSTTSENPVENKIVTSALNEKANTSSLANVATTGSYNDLSNKPEIDTNLSTESTNAVQNKVITNSLDEKYPIDYDVALSLAEWEALGEEKYYNHKNYYIYDAGTPTEKPVVYGWHVDPNESDPTAAVSYIKEAIGMTPASMGTTTFNYGSWQNAFFMPKPCMVKENGEVDYYLDENDYTKAKDVITITSTPNDELPLSFNSTNEDITLNYQVYGKTVENLWDLDTFDCSTGGSFSIDGQTVTMTGNQNADNLYFSTTYFSAGQHTLTLTRQSRCYFVLGANSENADLRINGVSGTSTANASKMGCERAFFWLLDSSLITMTISSDAPFRIAFAPTATEYIVSNIMLTKGSTVPTRYVPYGTPDGVGEETENLIVGYIDNASIQLADGKIVSNSTYDLAIAPITQGVKYGVLFRRNWKNTVYGFFTNYPSKGSFTYNASRSDADNMTSFVFEAPITGYVALWSAHNDYYHNDICVVQSDFAPASYIPPGYKIPILNTSGVTENLFDKNTLIPDKYIDATGQLQNPELDHIATTDWIEVEPNTTYTITATGSGRIKGFYADKTVIKTDTYDDYYIDFTGGTFSTGQQTAYIRFSIQPEYVDTCMFVEGSAPPDHYIPHRYESNYDLFIGDTKLYEDEYLDFVEQKVYKRTVQLFNKDAKDTNNGYVANKYLKSTGEETRDASDAISEYIPIKSNTTYKTLYADTTVRYNSAAVCFYDVNKVYISGTAYSNDNPKSFLTPSNAVYIRLSYRRASINMVTLYEGADSDPTVYQPYYEPTDPPAPFPTIQTYQGENTISSTETLNSFSIYAMSDITNMEYQGNAMIEWPLIWWKYESGKVDGEGSFYVSNRKIDDTYNCWCNYNSKNNIISNFYTAIYNGGIYNGKLRSMSGYKLTDMTSTVYSNTSTYAIDDKVLYNSNMYICITAITTPEDFDNNKWQQIPINGITTGTQEVNAATANNTTSDVEWYIDVWADRMLINGLLILMGKSLNSQAIFGRGLDTGSSTAKEAYVTGSLNDKGLFWGNISTGTSGVKVFGMENWWGCVYHRTAGLVGTSTGYAYKMTYNNIDGSTATSYNSNGSGYLTLSTTRPSANNYVIKMKYGPFGYIPIDTTGGSSTTYYCDYYYGGNGFLLVGGDANGGGGAGASSFILAGSFAARNWYIAASLTLKPLGSP